MGSCTAPRPHAHGEVYTRVPLHARAQALQAKSSEYHPVHLPCKLAMGGLGAMSHCRSKREGRKTTPTAAKLAPHITAATATAKRTPERCQGNNTRIGHDERAMQRAVLRLARAGQAGKPHWREAATNTAERPSHHGNRHKGSMCTVDRVHKCHGALQHWVSQSRAKGKQGGDNSCPPFQCDVSTNKTEQKTKVAKEKKKKNSHRRRSPHLPSSGRAQSALPPRATYERKLARARGPFPGPEGKGQWSGHRREPGPLTSCPPFQVIETAHSMLPC